MTIVETYEKNCREAGIEKDDKIVSVLGQIDDNTRWESENIHILFLVLVPKGNTLFECVRANFLIILQSQASKETFSPQGRKNL